MFDVRPDSYRDKKYNPFAVMQGDFYLGLSSLSSLINFCSGCSLQVLHKAMPQSLTGLSASIPQPINRSSLMNCRD